MVHAGFKVCQCIVNNGDGPLSDDAAGGYNGVGGLFA
jgi:hypothetical protein